MSTYPTGAYLPPPPMAQVVPFTYREGATLAYKLYQLQEWLLETLIPHIADDDQKIRDWLTEQINIMIGMIDQNKDGIDQIKADWDARFQDFMDSLTEILEGLNDQAIANLVNNELSLLKQALNGKFLRRGHDYFVPEDYPEVIGTNPVNYSHAIMSAIRDADGKPVILESGKEYPIYQAIVNINTSKIDLRSSGVEPAIIKRNGQNLNALLWFQPGGSEDQEGGEFVQQTTLIESMGIDGRGWKITDPRNVEPGMLCSVISSKLWYHDPRPGEGEARKSELHKVSRVEGDRIFFEDVANDGYNVNTEGVTLRFYKPLSVNIENITISGVLPDYAETTGASIGLRVDFALNAVIKNVNVENTARTGIYVGGCYNALIEGGYSKRINNYFNGYGVSVSGNALTRVTGRTIVESRRGVDFTSTRHGLISRMCTVDNSRSIGGGVNSRGESYGWEMNGAVGAYQGGFGSHGGVDNITYRNNFVHDMHAPFTIRGRNSHVTGNSVYGRTTGGVVWASHGVNLFVENNNVFAGYWPMKDRDAYNEGYLGIDLYRADNFVTIYDTWQSNPAEGLVRGQLRIMNNNVEVKGALLRLAMFHRGETFIQGNHVFVAHSNNDFQPYLISTTSADVNAQVTPGALGAWTIAGNRMQRSFGVAPLLASFSLEGAYLSVPERNGYTSEVSVGNTTTATGPHVAGTILTLTATFDKPFNEPPKVVTQFSGYYELVNITSITNTGFTVQIRVSKDYQYGMGGTYVAVGKRVI